jgi:hypothetical protein
MMQTLIHHAAACLVTLLSLVALTFIAKRLGLRRFLKVEVAGIVPAAHVHPWNVSCSLT